jgi:O-antigen ligase
MLTMIAPLALIYTIRAKDLRKRLLYGACFGILMVGALSTLRRTAVIAPLALLVVFMIYRPKDLMRLVPLGLPAYVMLQVLAPGAGGNLKGQLTGTNSSSTASTEGRSSDYIAIHFDVLHAPLLGRGYGSYQPFNYRVLDNQYLLLLIEIGIVGVLCFMVVMAATWIRGHQLQRVKDPAKAWFGVAAIATTAVFATVSALFDTLAFPQAMYTFMLISALLAVVVADHATPEADDEPPPPAETPLGPKPPFRERELRIDRDAPTNGSGVEQQAPVLVGGP